MNKLKEVLVQSRVDGRRLRSQASRVKIVEALMEIIAETGQQGLPSAEVVAVRAGVGLRTVFRLFEDMDGLYRGMQVVLTERYAPMLEIPGEGVGTWRERLVAMIDRRAGFYEATLPLQVAADSQRHRSTALQEGRALMVRILREALIEMLPAAAKTDQLRLHGLELALSFEAWRRLRLDQNVTPEGGREVMARMAFALLEGVD